MSYLKKKTSGIFIPDGSRYIDLKGAPDTSINRIIEHLGYARQQVYGYFVPQDKSDIRVIYFKIFTRDIVFIVGDNSMTYISHRTVKQHLTEYSVAKIFDGLLVSDILDEGIVNENLTIEFMSEVLNLHNTSSNGVFYSEKIKTYLYFTEGVLTNYQFDDGLFPWAKNLKHTNRYIYNTISDAALTYRHDNPFLALKEINLQAQAWANIPDAGGNKFTPLHTNNGTVNFHMLSVCHYGLPINKQEFEELNYGRFKEIASNENDIVYQLGNFRYEFSTNGNLIQILPLKSSL